MPDLKLSLLIPHDYFMYLQIIENNELSFTLNWYNYILKLSDQVPITINYEQKPHLPMLHVYKIIYSTADSLDITGYVTSEKNQNLTHLEKLLL